MNKNQFTLRPSNAQANVCALIIAEHVQCLKKIKGITEWIKKERMFSVSYLPK